jgi:hypothetical protein
MAPAGRVDGKVAFLAEDDKVAHALLASALIQALDPSSLRELKALASQRTSRSTSGGAGATIFGTLVIRQDT